MLISRSDRSKKAIWFWTIDRWLFSSFLILVSLGAFFIMASGPKIASNLGFDTHFFTIRHIIFLIIGFFIVLFFSQINEKYVKIFSIIGLVLCLFLMGVALINGISAKGAQRWVYIFGQSIQPSEFLKPFYIVVNAWFLHLWKKNGDFHGWFWSILTLLLIIFLLLLQPDLGMTFLIISVWIVQIFLSGVSIKLFLLFMSFIPIILVIAYYNFDHVYHRINVFIEGTSFQSLQAIKSFQTGGFFGKGLGEGSYKNNLPDAHTDFIFAVIAEEFGMVICCIIVILYAVIIFRSLFLATKGKNLFFILAISGLSFLFGIQSIIHISSNIGIIPTKGVTLPFLSYGGSSTISSSILIGILMTLTRKQIDFNEYKNNLDEK